MNPAFWILIGPLVLLVPVLWLCFNPDKWDPLYRRYRQLEEKAEAAYYGRPINKR